MDLISQGAVRAEKVIWRHGQGGFTCTVVCKATFELRPGVSPLAAAQDPVLLADVASGESGSLTLASDLVPFKKRPEALVKGHAHAPDGQAVTSLVARLATGEIDKAVQVTGDRYFALDGRLGEPGRFVRMPLVWERAAGGPDTSNPAGVVIGDGAKADFLGRIQAPNLLAAGVTLVSRGDIVAPVSLGPIAPLWPSRAVRLHRHAGSWDPGRWHERPLPDIDLAFFNAAPSDQQRTLPFGEDPLYLENLHPRFAILSTRFEQVAPVVTLDLGAGPQPLQARCDTLIIDSDRGLAMLLWRAHLPVDHPDRPARILVTMPASAAPAAAPVWPQHVSDPRSTLAPGLVSAASPLPFPERAASGLPTHTPSFGIPRVIPGAPPPASAPSFGAPPVAANAPVFGGPASPPSAPSFGAPPVAANAPVFGGPASPPSAPSFGAPPASAIAPSFGAPPASAPPASAPPDTLSVPLRRRSEMAVTLTGVDHDLHQKLLATAAALPFASQGEKPSAAPFPPQSESRPFRAVMTVLPGSMSVSATGALPFVEPGAELPHSHPQPPQMAQPPLQPPQPTGRSVTTEYELSAPLGLPAWMTPSPSPEPPALAPPALMQPAVAPPALMQPALAPPPPLSFAGLSGPEYTPLAPLSIPLSPEPSPEPPAPVRSGLLGALALSSAPAAPRAAEAGDTERPPPPEPAAGAAEPLVAREPPFEKYPPERCGAIAARLSCDEAAAPEILRAEELDSAGWEQVHAHWLARIREDAARSKKKALTDYDRAYVGVLEARRGVIALDDYARLAEAAERGAVEGALFERGLPERAWPHIHRVWIGRMAGDSVIGKQVRSAIDTLRAAD